MTKQTLEAIRIIKPDDSFRQEIQERWDSIAKPLDSLGEFEHILAQIGAINRDTELDIQKKVVIIMCADNGIVAEHISQSGQEVTAKVAESMGKRASSVCRMAAAVGAEVIPVDIGICQKEPIAGVLDKKVAYGTRNFLIEEALTEEEVLQAIETGMELVRMCKEQGYRLVATGEMGIGNTTTSSAVAAALLSCEAEQITGKGAGLSREGLRHKIEVIKQALQKYQLQKEETLRILASVGGLDIAGLAGVFLGGAVYGIPVVLDGVISAVAALAAERVAPGVRDYVIPSHRSREPAAAFIMEELRVHPVIDAGLALGEGTGAVMMFGLLDTACAVYGEKTTFADIRVAAYQRFE